MFFSEFQFHLRRQKFFPGYFLFGSDAYLQESARNILIGALQKAWGSDSLCSTVDLDQVSIDNLLEEASSSSLFAPKQIIKVKGVMKLRDPQGRKLADYFEKPNPDTVLVFLGGYLDRNDRKKKIFRVLETGTQIVDLVPLSEMQTKTWAHKQLKKKDFSIEEEALEALIELQGTDLGRLHSELEKLMLFAGEHKKVSLQMVHDLTGNFREYTIFDFLDAVLIQDQIKALRLSHELTSQPAEMLSMVTLLARRIRTLIQIQELSTTMGLSEMAGQIGASPYFLKRLLLPAKRFRRQTLMSAIDRLGQIDDRIKNSSLDSQILMEMLVRDLTQNSGEGRRAAR